MAKGIGEFETYIRNNEESIPNFGERYQNDEMTVEHIYCCRPGQRCLTMNSTRYFADGIRDSAQRRDPRPASFQRSTATVRDRREIHGSGALGQYFWIERTNILQLPYPLPFSSSRRFNSNAALINPKCVNACGKLPRCSPDGLNSSAKRPK